MFILKNVDIYSYHVSVLNLFWNREEFTADKLAPPRNPCLPMPL